MPASPALYPLSLHHSSLNNSSNLNRPSRPEGRLTELTISLSNLKTSATARWTFPEEITLAK